jgi:type III pantothenate kinase
MLLAIDVGNTNIVLGVFDGATLVQSWRLQTLRERTSDELGLLVDGLFAHSRIERVQIRGVILGSVVPPLTGTIRAMVQRYFGVPALIVEPGVNTPMPILYDNPSEVGADRIANTLAAHRRYGGPAVIVDFGTTTNFDVVSEDGDFLGGSFAPGLELSAESLFGRASRLFRVALTPPPTAIGKNTADCLRSGLVFGYVGLVEGLLSRILAELPATPRVIATGGLASTIAPLAKGIELVDEDLTLEGLRLLYELNA